MVQTLRRNILNRWFALKGPKGLGKSYTLKYLHDYHYEQGKSILVDLDKLEAYDIVNDITKEENITLLLDNAQDFKDQFNVDVFQLVVAAYSPNADIQDDILKERLGSITPLVIYFTP